MNDNEQVPHSKVVIRFKTSSTRGGQEAYEVTVTDQAMLPDVERALHLATLARREAQAEIDGDHLSRKLEASAALIVERKEGREEE